MINFQEVFEANYQYCLKEIDYRTVESDPKDNIEIKIKDDIPFTCSLDDNKFKFDVRRSVLMVPTAVYQLTVSFGVTLTILEDAPDLSSIDWSNEFKTNPVFENIIQGMMSRISVLISQITGASGKTPLVTPPGLQKE